RYFLTRLEQALTQPRLVGGQELAVMLVMLRNWRELRERLDLASSDELLRQVARRLSRLGDWARETARVGDTLFALLVRAADQGRLLARAREIVRALEQHPYRLDEQPVTVESCVGIGLIRPGEQDHQEIMQRADFALSLAREKSGERIHLLASGATPVLEASRQAELLVKVSDAVRNERMRLLFQPIASLRGDRRERYEVLLRLYQDSGEELLAESVFALAQRSSKLGQTLDRWVVAQCLRVLQQGQDSTLFIQLSPATVNDTVWPNWLRERLARSQVAPVRLVFELSEHTARQQQALLPGFAAALRELGCGLALNRFGRHADSMAFIQGLPLHYVKLDSRFVRDLGGGQTVEARQMLHDLVENLGERGVQVIVGGIEELHVLPALWGCGVDLVQGFFLQRPHEEMNYDFAGEVL
ncbi:MAG TPA: GGDEF domain-containing protein, partial [Candidatus Competibacteraceae bacterium]|nr:GGDEF domain-containing protein [Candidatus Competibacteraceae bacterium]